MENKTKNVLLGVLMIMVFSTLLEDTKTSQSRKLNPTCKNNKGAESKNRQNNKYLFVGLKQHQIRRLCQISTAGPFKDLSGSHVEKLGFYSQD